MLRSRVKHTNSLNELMGARPASREPRAGGRRVIFPRCERPKIAWSMEHGTSRGGPQRSVGDTKRVGVKARNKRNRQDTEGDGNRLKRLTGPAIEAWGNIPEKKIGGQKGRRKSHKKKKINESWSIGVKRPRGRRECSQNLTGHFRWKKKDAEPVAKYLRKGLVGKARDGNTRTNRRPGSPQVREENRGPPPRG